MKKPSALLFRWRWAYMSSYGPRSTTRLVLLAVALHMDKHGQRAFPSQSLLAEETGLTRRAVGKHLKEAEETGWITRRRVRLHGKTWAQTFYAPTIPDRVSRAQDGDAQAALPVARAAVPGRPVPEPGAAAAEQSSRSQGNHVPTNSSENSIKNSAPKADNPGYKKFREVCEQLGIAKALADESP
jgi:hypothetical protein